MLTSICHLAGAIHDAAHDGDGNAREVACPLPDLVCDLLQGEQGAAA